MTASECSVILCTANQPGAIAIVQLIGVVEPMLQSLTGRNDWPVGMMRLAPIADIDEGLVARLDRQLVQLMPHGGPRVVQRLMQRLIEHGCDVADDTSVDPMHLYPEATDQIEALTLHALARARSPMAIDLLLDQPNRWRESTFSNERGELDRARRLNRVIDPPLVVLAGPANVGKSTLSNALLGRSMSIEYDQPGTTRDYTAGMIDLNGLVVRWLDTPGLRETSDEIERRAIELARGVMDRADLLIAMTDHEHDWPALPRDANLRIASKHDIAPRADADLSVSAHTCTGVASLVTRVRDLLVPPEDLLHPGPWLFDENLWSPDQPTECN